MYFLRYGVIRMRRCEGVRRTYLVLRCGAPVCYALGIRDAFLEPVGSEGAEHDAGCAVEAADCPERWGHFLWPQLMAPSRDRGFI